MGKCVVHFLPAKAGDCFLLELKHPSCILIDCGFKNTYEKELKPLLLRLCAEGYRISLMIVSHMDRDHIEGAVSFLKENGAADAPNIIPVENIWMNGFFNTLFRLPEFDARRATSLSEPERRKRDRALKELKMQTPDEGPISASESRAFEELCAQGGYRVNWSFPEGTVKTAAQSREEALEAAVSIAGCRISVLGPRDAQLAQLAKKLNQDMIGWFGRDYKITEDAEFAELFERLMQLYKEPVVEEEIAAVGTDLKSWLNTSTRAPMNEVNRASIVIEICYEDKRMLFTGDGESGDWVDLLAADYQLIKISHHGSMKPNVFLLEKSYGERILISTNGGRSGRHPEDELLARAIQSGAKELHFNYDIKRKRELITFQTQYHFSAHFGERVIVL